MQKEGFTHYARFFGVPCYWNHADNTLVGRNWFCEQMLRVAVIIHIFLLWLSAPLLSALGIEMGFPISIKPFDEEG